MTRGLVLRAAVLAALLSATALLPPAAATVPQDRSIFDIDTFDSGLGRMAVPLRPGTTDDSASLTLPQNAQVINASMELTSLPATENGLDYPASPAMDLGADGAVEWAYSGFAYGAMGFQRIFHDYLRTADGYNLSFGAGEQKVLRTRLPANATVLSAKMNVGGWPAPFWRDPMHVTPGGSPGENSPAFYAAEDRLWVAWASEDPALTNGTDWDIVVSWSFDGTAWAPPVDISPPGDAYEDDSPDICGYNGKIFVTWSAAESESQFSASNVYIRSWDGTRWEDVLRLTPPGLRYMNDGPQLMPYKGALFCFWRTTDPTQANIDSGDDMDMVFRTYDGRIWSGIAELTMPGDTEIDWSLNLIEYEGRLFAFWDQDTAVGFGFTVDIFYRTFDGTSWGPASNIIPQPDHELDEIPKAAVYSNPVTGHDELWVVWIRGSPSEHDLDIMARRYDGASWGPVMELTDPSKDNDNMGQELIEYDHRLYVVWVTGTNTSEETNETIAIYNTYGDVVIRAYDGYGWSDRMELTPGEENDNANSPNICVFGGKLYVAWAYPYPPQPGGTETWDIVVRNIDFRQVVLEVDMGNDGLSDWGPSELESTNERIPLYTDELNRALRRAPRSVDDHGNEMCDLELRLRSIYPSKMLVGNLSIEYSYVVRFDNLSTALNSLLAASRLPGRGRADEGNVTFPFRLWADSTGKLELGRLNLTYLINRAPVLIDDLPHPHFPEDTDAVRLIDLEEFFWDDWDDGDLEFEVTYASEPRHIEARVDGRYLSFTTPTEDWYGTESFGVRAYDRPRLWADSNLFCVTVDPVNDPPMLAPIPDQRAHVGDNIRFEAHASDVDLDPLFFSCDDARFPLLPLRNDPNGAAVSYVAVRPGSYFLNISVSDGHGGNDTRMVFMRIDDKVSSTATEVCLSWLVVIAVAAAAGLAAERYRRRYMRDIGPITGPDGEITEVEAFEGTVAAVRLDASISGGSEGANPERYTPMVKRPLTREQLKAEKKRIAEERIKIPDAAVSADQQAASTEAQLRRQAAGATPSASDAVIPPISGALSTATDAATAKSTDAPATTTPASSPEGMSLLSLAEKGELASPEVAKPAEAAGAPKDPLDELIDELNRRTGQ